MLLSEGIYFRKHFLWYVWQVDSKREIVPRSSQSYGIARTPWTVHRFLEL